MATPFSQIAFFPKSCTQPISIDADCGRGNGGGGNDAVMTGLEEPHIPYLYEAARGQHVTRFVERVSWRRGWVNTKKESESAKAKLIREEGTLSDNMQQPALSFVEKAAAMRCCEYFVLIANLAHLGIRTLAQFSRDSTNSENTIDKPKSGD